MNATRALAGLFGLLLLAGALGYFLGAAHQEPAAERRVTFLTINDNYRLDGVEEGRAGGLHRLRTLRRMVERDAPGTLLLHAGDFLSPSLIGSIYKGAQMVDAMNHLDGDGKAFDPRMFVAFGNHEFDDSRCNRASAPLPQRIDESQFTWLVSNLDFSDCAPMKDIPSRKNVRDGVVTEVNGVKVGLFGIGLTPDKESAPKFPRFENAVSATRRSIDALRKQGAALVVAVTHLPREDDEALLREFGGKGLDVLVGGHDHNNMVLFDAAGVARGFKADSDTRTAWRIDVLVPRGGAPRIEAQLIALNEAVAGDPALAKLAQDWMAKAEAIVCAERAKAKNEPSRTTCLNEVVGLTQTPIELEETPNRSAETGFGNWLADLMLRETGADVALINAGSLGLNEDLPGGSRLKLSHIVDIFRFDDVMAVRTFSAKQVCAALAHGLVRPGNGGFPHYGGLEASVTRQGTHYVRGQVTRFRKEGLDCDSEAPVKLAAPPFVLCGGDDYPLLPANDQCIAILRAKPFEDQPDRAGRTLGVAVEQAVRAAGAAGIRPVKDGRLQFAD